MSRFRQNDIQRTGQRWFVVAICLLLAGLTAATVPGCGGCRNNKKTAAQKKKEEEERRKKEEEQKKKKKPDFEVGSLMGRPRSGLPSDTQLQLGPPYKPGHWTPATLAVKTNHYDFLGDLDLVVTDSSQKPLPLLGMPYQLSVSRPVALTKGQAKLFESAVYVPPQGRRAWVSCRLRARRGGREMLRVQHPLQRMPSYQYHFVVLAREPARYTYLSSLHTVRPPSDDFTNQVPTAPYYRLAFLSTDRRAALPAQAMLWTSIAGVLWDDASPESFDVSQQRALIDWLHWGGHLVISGPQSLDALADSFLAPYLPATAEGGREFDGDDFDVFHQWSLREDRLPAAGGDRTIGDVVLDLLAARANDSEKPAQKPIVPKQVPRLAPVKPISGIRLLLRSQARFLPGAGELLAERRVGRGRIVVSGFPLSGRAVTSWKGWDELVHAFLLRRPPRKFIESDQATLQAEWADGHERLDAARVTGLRYFSRDTGVTKSTYGADVASGAAMTYGENSPAGPGLAAWNDFSSVTAAARDALREAARIEIPKRDFIVWVVAGYLAVLVPLNWLVFRLLGRVEWAWVAAPVIAIVCTATVIHLARLDIGFARSQTEVGVLEVQGEYPRAHLTRYNAVYTSLSESYDIRSDDPGAVIQPLPERPGVTRPEDFQLGFGESYRRLRFDRGDGVCLTGLFVRSNDRRFVHSEEMTELPGPLTLTGNEAGGYALHNQTGLTLQGAGVIRRRSADRVERAWLGDVLPGATVPVRFAVQADGAQRFWPSERRGTVLGPATARGELSLATLAALAEDADHLEPGEVRLTAAATEPIRGVRIEPSSRQSGHAVLVVAHLAYRFGSDPQPDWNAPTVRPPTEAPVPWSEDTAE